MILYVIVLYSVRNCWNCEYLCSHSTSRKPVEDVEASTSLHPQQNSKSSAWVFFSPKRWTLRIQSPDHLDTLEKWKKHVPALIGCTRFLTRRRDGPGWPGDGSVCLESLLAKRSSTSKAFWKARVPKPFCYRILLKQPKTTKDTWTFRCQKTSFLTWVFWGTC